MKTILIASTAALAFCSAASAKVFNQENWQVAQHQCESKSLKNCQIIELSNHMKYVAGNGAQAITEYFENVSVNSDNTIESVQIWFKNKDGLAPVEISSTENEYSIFNSETLAKWMIANNKHNAPFYGRIQIKYSNDKKPVVINLGTDKKISLGL